jgi:hypothetical protein
MDKKKLVRCLERVQYYCESAHELVLDFKQTNINKELILKKLENLTELLVGESIYISEILNEGKKPDDLLITEKLDKYGIKYKKQGECLVMLCPFHEEKTPSCCYRIKEKDFRCMGCGKNFTEEEFFEFLDLKKRESDILQQIADIDSMISDMPS